MTLDEALYILAHSHTRDDEMVGFTVHARGGPEPWFGFGRGEYIEAWKTVRMHLHMNVNPTPQENDTAVST